MSVQEFLYIFQVNQSAHNQTTVIGKYVRIRVHKRPQLSMEEVVINNENVENHENVLAERQDAMVRIEFHQDITMQLLIVLMPRLSLRRVSGVELHYNFRAINGNDSSDTFLQRLHDENQ